jgi:F-type H+-transporting ATPase subunit b
MCGLTLAVFAEGASEVDLLWRAINFVIFAGLVYWFFANMTKQFFKERSVAIVAAFEKAQDKAKEARNARNEAAKELEKAKLSAESIVELAKEEAHILSERIKAKAQEEIVVLHKLKEETKIVLENKMVRSVVAKTLGDILNADDFLSNQDAIVDNLIKRVA